VATAQQLMATRAFLPDATTLPAIETARLRLRWITPDDVPALFEIFGNPAVCRYWSRAAMSEAREAEELQREIVSFFEERSLFQWGIADRTSNVLIGTCTLAELCAQHRRASIGYALAQSAWGSGYAREALPALLDFAFGTLVLHRIEADVDPGNLASIRVLEHLGFSFEGHQRERYFLSDEWQDAHLYGLLKRDWRR
jgi:RimJ/RimL family protein N-acetyltransferase